MIIRKPRPKSNFYMLDKSISEDLRLTWAARGLLVFLLGKPDHWQVSTQALINETKQTRNPTGRDGVRAIMGELMAAGYVQRTPARAAGGKLDGYDYSVSEEHFSPATAEPATAEPATAEPATAEPAPANHPLVSIESLARTEKDTTKTSVAALAHIDRPDDIDVSIWCDFLALRNKKKAVVTSTAVIGLRREAALAGWSMDDALIECCARGWVGFNHKWVITDKPVESAYTKSMREKYEILAPRVAAKNPAARINPNTYFDNLAKEQPDVYIN